MNQRRQLRKRQRVDYAALASGPTLPKTPEQSKENWSTKRLYQLEVIDHTIDNGIPLLKAHYVGWSSKYYEWRTPSDIVDIPQYFIASSLEAETTFKSELKVAIKESLHCSRKCDSLVELSVSLPKDTFKVVSDCGVAVLGKSGKWTLRNHAD